MNLKLLKHLETITGKFPSKELNYLIENQEEVTEELLQIIDYTVKNAEELAEDNFILHIVAMYTLAYFREKQAYPGIISIARLPSEIVEPLLEDTITESLAGIIASVFDGDLLPIKGIIEECQCDEYVRRAAVRSIAPIMANNLTDRDEAIKCFKDTQGMVNIESILEEATMRQEDKLISKEDVLSLSKWLGNA